MMEGVTARCQIRGGRRVPVTANREYSAQMSGAANLHRSNGVPVPARIWLGPPGVVAEDFDEAERLGLGQGPGSSPGSSRNVKVSERSVRQQIVDERNEVGIEPADRRG